MQASPPFPHSFRAKSSCSDYVLAMANLNLYLFLKKCDFSVVICPLTINTNEDLHESKEIIYSYFYPNNLKIYPISRAPCQMMLALVLTEVTLKTRQKKKRTLKNFAAKAIPRLFPASRVISRWENNERKVKSVSTTNLVGGFTRAWGNSSWTSRGFSPSFPASSHGERSYWQGTLDASIQDTQKRPF